MSALNTIRSPAESAPSVVLAALQGTGTASTSSSSRSIMARTRVPTATEYDWQTCMGKLAQRAAFLLRSEWRSDVDFLVGQEPYQQPFKAHKLILGMSSPVFEAMLFGGMAEKTEQPINIPDVHPEAFKALLEYIYTDEINLHAVDKAVELCYAGKKYMLPQLVRQCTQFIWKDLSPSNACRAFEFAKLFEVTFLIDKCIQMFKAHTEEVLKSEDFPDVTADTLRTILSFEEMNVQSEKVVFDAVLVWARQECIRQELDVNPKTIREALVDSLFMIRFFAMTPSEFTSGPGISGLFSDKEMLAILMNISIPGIKTLPSSLAGMSTNPARRNQCSKRYYCALSHPIPDNLIQLMQAPVITELRLFVDRDIFFHGVLFNSQVQHPSVITSPLALLSTREINEHHDDSTSDSTTYQEYMLMQLCSADCDPLVETRLSKRVRWNEKVEVVLERPFLVHKHTGYVLRITFASVGSYKKYTDLMGPSQIDGVHITCSYINGFLVAVHSIIFSCTEPPPSQS